MGGSFIVLADLEVFLEAVRLGEVGEFEGADVAALGADLPLETGDDSAQIRERVAQAQEHSLEIWLTISGNRQCRLPEGSFSDLMIQ